MKQELLEGLSEEQIAKVKACNSAEEILALAKAEGLELTEEQLEAASGGTCLHLDAEPKDKCPVCGSTDVKLIAHQYLVCSQCKHRWAPAVTVNR